MSMRKFIFKAAVSQRIPSHTMRSKTVFNLPVTLMGRLLAVSVDGVVVSSRDGLSGLVMAQSYREWFDRAERKRSRSEHGRNVRARALPTAGGYGGLAEAS